MITLGKLKFAPCSDVVLTVSIDQGVIKRGAVQEVANDTSPFLDESLMNSTVEVEECDLFWQ